MLNRHTQKRLILRLNSAAFGKPYCEPPPNQALQLTAARDRCFLSEILCNALTAAECQTVEPPPIHAHAPFIIKAYRKIGHADLLIASIVLAHRAILVTRNVRHFRQLQGITVINWVD